MIKIGKKCLWKLCIRVLIIGIIFGVSLLLTNGDALAASKKLKATAPKSVAINCQVKIMTNMKATYKTSNRKIATVNRKGVVTGKRAGTATIIVKAKKQIKKMKIKVKKQLVVKNVEKNKVTMNIGDKFKINTNLSAKYKANNKNISVDKKGVIKAKKVGKSKIIITSKKYKNLKKKITVVVKNKENKNTTEDSTTEASTTQEETTEKKTTQDKSTEAITEQTTIEDKTTEAITEDKTTEQTTTENSNDEDDVENKTGYSRIEWLKTVMSSLEIEPLTVESIKKNDIHKIEYSFQDMVSDDIKLILETGVSEGIIEVQKDENGFAFFNPDEAVTREDAVVMAVKALKYTVGNVEPDCLDVSELKNPYLVQIGINKGMISLIDGAFCGDKTLSVDEAQQIISVLKDIHLQDTATPKEIQEVVYNDELIMESVQEITSYTVEETEVGYMVTLPLVDVEDLGIVAGKTIYLPADDAGEYTEGFPCVIQEVKVTEEAVILGATAVTDITDVFESYHLSGQRQPTKFIPAEGITVSVNKSAGKVSGVKSTAGGAGTSFDEDGGSKYLDIGYGDTELSYNCGGLQFKFTMSSLPKINFDFVGSKSGIEYMKVTLESTERISVNTTGGVEERIVLGDIVAVPIGKGFEVKGTLVAIVSANGEISYEVTATAEAGFEYGNGLRPVYSISSSESGSLKASVEVLVGPEISLYWIDEKLTVADVTPGAGVGFDVKCTSGMNADFKSVECQERRIYGFISVVAGKNKSSLLHEVLEHMGLDINWKLGEKTFNGWHYESMVGQGDGFKPVEYCTVRNNILSGKVLTSSYELVPNAIIHVRSVSDPTKYTYCFSNSAGVYESTSRLAEGEYEITARWNKHLRYSERVELMAEDFEEFDIVETATSKQGEGYSWVLEPGGMFHCYVDETADMQDIKADLQVKKQEIVHVKMSGVVGEQSMEEMFYQMDKLKGVDLTALNTHNVTSMRLMFGECKNLERIQLGTIDTINVTDMSAMFFRCQGLKNLNLYSLDTGNVEDMNLMFYFCVNLENLDLRNFNTSKVKDMSSMFASCKKMGSVNLSSFDTSQVIDMNRMFYDCKYLSEVDVSSFDTSNVVDMDSMFCACDLLINLNLNNFDTSNVTDMHAMFYECKRIENIDISSFDTDSVTNMSHMFADCSKLLSLDVSGLDTSNVTTMYNMFGDCSKLLSLDVSGFDTSKVENMHQMFNACSALTSLDVSGFDTSNVTTMYRMFGDCKRIASLDVSGFNTSRVTDMAGMFTGCTSVQNLDVSGFDTSNVIAINGMFCGCANLTTLDVGNFDTSNVEKMQAVFSGCEKLESLDVSGFDTSKATGMSYMFSQCSSLTALNVGGFDTSNVINMADMFSQCKELESLDVSGFDTSKVTDMSRMFYQCSRLSILDVSGFNTSKVKSMSEMFSGCSILSELDVNGFDISNVGSMFDMFYQCPLVELPEWYKGRS